MPFAARLFSIVRGPAASAVTIASLHLELKHAPFSNRFAWVPQQTVIFFFFKDRDCFGFNFDFYYLNSVTSALSPGPGT